MTLYIEHNPSPHYEPRKDGKTPRFLILHYTEISAAETIRRFTDPQTSPRVSAHYLVHENGHITQFVHERDRAWHAGVSFWLGEMDINSTSLGIEIENKGQSRNFPLYDPNQINSVITLCLDILHRHPAILPFGVLGHSDVAPGRKRDPGPAFPWGQLAAAGVGMMPDPHLNCPPIPDLEAGLTQWGYDPTTPLVARLSAFCAHYNVQTADAPQALARLIRQKQIFETQRRNVL